MAFPRIWYRDVATNESGPCSPWVSLRYFRLPDGDDLSACFFDGTHSQTDRSPARVPQSGPLQQPLNPRPGQDTVLESDIRAVPRRIRTTC